MGYDEAYSEVVADSMEAMLADGNVLEKLAELKKTDRSLFDKIREFFDKLAGKIRQVYKDLKPDSREGQAVQQMKGQVERIQQLFAEALADAGENFQAAEEQKNTTPEGGVNRENAVMRSERIVDQIRNSLPEIMTLDSVYIIDASNATPYTSDRKTDETSGSNVFKKQGGAAYRPGFGRVVLGKKGAVNTVFHGNGPAKQAAFPAIKAVIENGIEIGWDYNHNNQGFDTVTFAAPVNFFNTKAPLGVVVKVFDNGRGDKSFYIHEICDAEGNYIELADGVPAKKEISNTGLVDSSSTAGAADNGISPKTSIRNTEPEVNKKFSTRDSRGTELSPAQAEYFRDSKVRDADGNLLVMYHGTPNGGFTKFRSGSYFTQHPEYAALYQNPNASSLSVKRNAENRQNYEVYLNITKPFDTRNPKERRIFMQEYYRQWGTGAPLSDSGLPDWTDGMDLQEFIEEMGYKDICDSIRAKTGGTETLKSGEVSAAIDGIQAGGGFPEKIYETDFVVEETIPSGNATICTISTGLSTDIVAVGGEELFAAFTCEPSDTSLNHYAKAVQWVYPNQGGVTGNTTISMLMTIVSSGAKVFRPINGGVRLSAIGVDLATLTVAARSDTAYGVAGNYHLELYRTGVSLL